MQLSILDLKRRYSPAYFRVFPSRVWKIVGLVAVFCSLRRVRLCTVLLVLHTVPEPCKRIVKRYRDSLYAAKSFKVLRVVTW